MSANSNLAEVFVFNQWREDSEKENNGVWGDFEHGLRVKIRATTAQIVKDRTAKKAEELREKKGQANIDGKDFLELMEDVHSETLACDWEGLHLNKGEPPTPFSEATAKHLWKTSRRWRDMLRNFASKNDNYAVSNEEAQEKN